MSIQKFNQVEVTCTDNDKIVKADVLQMNEKMLKVALVGSTVAILLTRKDTNKQYVGNFKNLEFTSTGEIL